MQQVQVQATTMYEADFGSLMSNAFSTVSYVGAATSASRPYALLDLDDRLLKDIGETRSGRHAR